MLLIMKKRFLLILLSILSYVQISAQISATTNGGKKVVLNEDGTWVYVEENNSIDYSEKGNWLVKYFVDDFGDPTSSGYISNNEILKGTFSNSATTNSELLLYFIISDSANVAIKLFEYGRNEVNAYSTNYYSVKVKNSNGEVSTFSGTIYENGDRLYVDPGFRKTHVSGLHKLLLKGGMLSFSIKESDSMTSYKFKTDATGYANAFNELY